MDSIIEALNNINPEVLYAGAAVIGVSAIAASSAFYASIRKVSDNRVVRNTPEFLEAKREKELTILNRKEEILKSPEYKSYLDRRESVATNFQKRNKFIVAAMNLRDHVDAVVGDLTIR